MSDYEGWQLIMLSTGSSPVAPGVISERQFGGTQFVCSVVASHVSHQPSTTFSFVWIAPPPGTGCVNFLEGEALEERKRGEEAEKVEEKGAHTPTQPQQHIEDRSFLKTLWHNSSVSKERFTRYGQHFHFL
ncbi:hypothetical protein PAMP_019920 [Pampus punctatissimus]